MNIQIQTTTGNKNDAEKIAAELLNNKLAACIQIIGPITSHYWWEGKIDTSEEYLCLIKTKQELYAEAEAAIKANHPYENPEIIATDLCLGSSAYFTWIKSETK